jgi:hypothetical protein
MNGAKLLDHVILQIDQCCAVKNVGGFPQRLRANRFNFASDMIHLLRTPRTRNYGGSSMRQPQGDFAAQPRRASKDNGATA